MKSRDKEKEKQIRTGKTDKKTEKTEIRERK